MKILFTGSSSFTGYWFIKALVAAGHDVVATFTSDAASYVDVRGERVRLLQSLCRCEFSASFGSSRFLDVCAEGCDVLCHHGAEVRDYRNPLFDVVGAVASNTFNVRTVLDRVHSKGASRIVLTGSVFEEGEGAGSDNLRAFSPYGVSKGLTAQIFRYHAQDVGIRMGKFVIPNPFGPLEEPRFMSYLIQTWIKGRIAEVRTPRYVRDNIHVKVLAGVYSDFVASENTCGYVSIHPSGYAERMDSFVARVAGGTGRRLESQCVFVPMHQETFPEPEIRINTDPTTTWLDNLGEAELWTELAEWYLGNCLR